MKTKKLESSKRRAKIVEIAVLLFSQSGFNGATTKELAKSAGISEALLFQHFPNKESLYQAILKHKMEEQFPLLVSELPQEVSLQVFLLELARRIEKKNLADPSFLRLLLFSALEEHQLSDLFFQKRTLPLVEFLRNYFIQKIREKKIKKIDPENTALAFSALVFGYVQTRVLFKIPLVVKKAKKDLLRHYIAIFCEGIEK